MDLSSVPCEDHSLLHLPWRQGGCLHPVIIPGRGPPFLNYYRDTDSIHTNGSLSPAGDHDFPHKETDAEFGKAYISSLSPAEDRGLPSDIDGNDICMGKLSLSLARITAFQTGCTGSPTAGDSGRSLSSGEDHSLPNLAQAMRSLFANQSLSPGEDHSLPNAPGVPQRCAMCKSLSPGEDHSLPNWSMARIRQEFGRSLSPGEDHSLPNPVNTRCSRKRSIPSDSSGAMNGLAIRRQATHLPWINSSMSG
jgi:hypothetical protein